MFKYIVGFILIVFFILSLWSHKPIVLNDNPSYNLEVFEEINRIRKVDGLLPVEYSYDLWESSREKAIQIETTCEWDHTIKGKTKWIQLIRDTGIDFDVGGEVLARGFEKPENVVKGWYLSPTHYDIIMGEKYNRVGVYSWLSECDGKMYSVAHFVY